MKKYALNLIPFVIGLGCFIAFNIIGSKVLPNGTLDEPFFLIPIACMFFAIGIVGVIGRLISFYIKSKQPSK